MPENGKNNRNDDLLHEVIERASVDREFRTRLLAEPVSAIRHAFGVILPHNFRIRFVERPADLDALVVLPPMGHGELDEDDLEQVAGGGETDVCGSW